MAYKCKTCGLEFENKKEELNHYKEYSDGTCAPDLEEGVPEAAKETVKPTVDVYAQQESAGNIESQVASIGKRMAQELKENYPQLRVTIHKDALNKADDRAIAVTNGYIWNVKRDVPVILPEPVVDIFRESGYPLSVLERMEPAGAK